MIADLINGGFELFAGAFVVLNCLQVMKDKQVKGVNILAVTFFTLWGFWNLYYYPSLNQWWSFVGGISIVGANSWWVYLLLKYRDASQILVKQ